MSNPRRTIGNRIAPIRFIVFAVLLILGFAGWRLCDPQSSWQDSLALGFDMAAAVFLVSLIPLLRAFSVEDMRRHARENDANRALLLTITTALAALILIAMVGELSAAKLGNDAAKVKLLGTLALAWLFANAVYALHYAHAFYINDANRAQRSGLEFPGTKPPDYRDFAYFAYTLGMTFQTSDIAITAPEIRRIVLIHSLVSFVFNIGVIAFTINALG